MINYTNIRYKINSTSKQFLRGPATDNPQTQGNYTEVLSELFRVSNNGCSRGGIASKNHLRHNTSDDVSRTWKHMLQNLK